MREGLYGQKGFSDEGMLGLKTKVELTKCRDEKYSEK